MRHGNAFRKFGRSPAHRRAMFRNMATSLLLNERCNTTVEKAKDLRRVVEKLITLGGTDTLHARRQAYAYIMDKAVVHKLFAEIGPRFKARPGGYTRVVKAGFRHGDAAKLAVIELVGDAEKAPVKAKKGAKTKTATATDAAPKKATKAKKAAAEETVVA